MHTSRRTGNSYANYKPSTGHKGLWARRRLCYSDQWQTDRYKRRHISRVFVGLTLIGVDGRQGSFLSDPVRRSLDSAGVSKSLSIAQIARPPTCGTFWRLGSTLEWDVTSHDLDSNATSRVLHYILQDAWTLDIAVQQAAREGLAYVTAEGYKRSTITCQFYVYTHGDCL